MTDFDVTFGADDRQVGATMGRVEKRAEKTAKEVEGRFARGLRGSGKAVENFANTASGRFGAVGASAGAMGIAIAAGAAIGFASISKYQDVLPLLADDIADVRSSFDNLAISLGRDLTLALDGSGGSLSRFLDGLNETREGIVDALAGIFSSEVGAVNEALAKLEAQERAARRIETLRGSQREVDIFTTRARGDDYSAGIIELDQRVEAMIQKINAQAKAGDISGSDASRLIGQVRAARSTEISRRTKDRIAAAEQEAKAEREKTEQIEKQEAARAKAEASQRQQFRLGLEQNRIEQLRLEGKDREAALAQVELRFSEQIRRVRESGSFDAIEQRAVIDRLERQRDAQLAATNDEFDERAAGNGGGLRVSVPTLVGGSRQLRSQVFGSGSKQGAPAIVSSIQEQTRRLGEKIDNVADVTRNSRGLR